MRTVLLNLGLQGHSCFTDGETEARGMWKRAKAPQVVGGAVRICAHVPLAPALVLETSLLAATAGALTQGWQPHGF